MGKVNLDDIKPGMNSSALVATGPGRKGLCIGRGFGSGQAFARSAAHLLVLQKHSRRQQLLAAN